MIPHIPAQRQFKANSAKPFNDLLTYIEAGQDQERASQRQLGSDFSDVIDYATAPTDHASGAEKCLAIRTHGVTGIATASIEMNTVAQKNTRCQDPVYHIILSWPEHEQPAPELIFDAAEHALDALGLSEHQYVLAVHGNTDNRHCHISVNRIHPRTFKSHNIAWAHKNLHRAARESEIKHGWSHDNGIYVVDVDANGKKQVVLSADHAAALAPDGPRVHRELGRDDLLPVWHDPDSLESWLKTKVTKALKPALAELGGWPALHAWLSAYDITLHDSGGGGLRLQATSAETGEILDLAASKGLRRLKRAELEQRWGPFANSQAVACHVPDLSHLTPSQIAQGVTAVLALAPQPPAHVLLARQAERSAPVEVPAMARDSDAATNPPRDAAQRAQRKAQRAAARLDLRQRFAQYRNEVRHGDAGYFSSVKVLQLERRLALSTLRAQSKAAKRAIPTTSSPSVRLISHVEIDAESLRRQFLVDADFQAKSQVLRAARTPPLSWRAWLLAQSGLGDQAALSALRGIVYQAQRDAKRDTAHEVLESTAAVDSAAYRAQQYQCVMARLLEEEKKEAAIRSAHSRAMRPYEADALLRRYSGMVWHVTGNGNVEYRDQAGVHLFTDRGNRVTFDRERVADDEICLALAHAEQKFGLPLTLTGDDQVFAARMARLADDMGISILNPELQVVIEQHRLACQASSAAPRDVEPRQAVVEASRRSGQLETPAELLAPTNAADPVRPVPRTDQEATPDGDAEHALFPRRRQRSEEGLSRTGPIASKVLLTSTPVVQSGEDRANVAAERISPEAIPVDAGQQDQVLPAMAGPQRLPTPHERLRAMVLAMEPNAQFVTALDDGGGVTYFGKVVARLGEEEPGIVQFSAKLNAFILHPGLSASGYGADDVIEVKYQNGEVTAKNSRGQGKGGRGD